MKKPECCDVDHARRSFLLNAGAGLGALSLLDLLGAGSASAQGVEEAMNAGVLGAGQIPARAKRVIMLHMLGAISHVDTFDYKPMLVKMHGQDLPASVRETQRLSTMSGGQSSFPIVGPLRPFRQHGESGAWVSDFLPYTGAIADELCFVKSMHTEHVNHDPASKFLHTGFQLAGRPSAGAWVSYALGSDNRDLPNFVVMNSGVSVGVPQDAAIWGSGFLPSHHQGVEFRAATDPVLYVNNPDGVDRADRRAIKQLRANVPGIRTSGPYICSTCSGSSEMSATSGIEACIRYAISYWLTRDRISGSFDFSCCSRASAASESSIARRSARSTPSGLLTYKTGSVAARNSTP